MMLKIEFTRRTAFCDVREKDSIGILCQGREDGLQFFHEHYPTSQGYKIESIEEDDPKKWVKSPTEETA